MLCHDFEKVTSKLKKIVESNLNHRPHRRIHCHKRTGVRCFMQNSHREERGFGACN